MRLLLIVAGLGLCTAHVMGVPNDRTSHTEQQDYSLDIFECKDHSAQIPSVFINDDFCDCPDGSDEPGTPACSNGQFYCRNEKFKPEYISSSKVLDTICGGGLGRLL